MLKWNPLERITSWDALEHPYFRGLEDNVSFADNLSMFKDIPKIGENPELFFAQKTEEDLKKVEILPSFSNIEETKQEETL